MKIREGNIASAVLELGFTPAELITLDIALSEMPEDYDEIKKLVDDKFTAPKFFGGDDGGFSEITSHLITGNLMFLKGKINDAMNTFIKGLEPGNGMYKKPKDRDFDFPFVTKPGDDDNLPILEDLINNTDFGEVISKLADTAPEINTAVHYDGEMFNLGSISDILSHLDTEEYSEIEDE